MDEFLDIIDNLIPLDVQEALQSDFANATTLIDLVNLQEKARVLTIKSKISSTHKWVKLHQEDNNFHKTELYWCNTCGLKCSSFEHINCISIISKVSNYLPTYTPHNEYLTITCDGVMKLQNSPGGSYRCIYCGIPTKGACNRCSLEGC